MVIGKVEEQQCRMLDKPDITYQLPQTMSLLSHLHPSLTLVEPWPPDAEESIEDVVTYSPIPVPEDVLEVMREASDEQFRVEMPGQDRDISHFRIWGAERCMEMNDVYSIEDRLGEALAIGDNGEGGMIVLIHNATPPGLYHIPMGGVNLGDGAYICPTLTDLLAHADNISRVWPYT